MCIVYMILQFHWNNPEEKSGMDDASGLNLYYTPTLRQHNAGNLFIGPALLMIPPGEVLSFPPNVSISFHEKCDKITIMR